jgi:hypothetical protein
VRAPKPNANVPSRNACCASKQRAEQERLLRARRAEQAERRLAELEAELKRLRGEP